MSVKPHKILNKKIVGLFLVACLLTLTWASLWALDPNNVTTKNAASPLGETGPSITQTFTPNTIGPGSVSTLRIDITNNFPNAADNMAFVNNLPAAITIATPAHASNSCGQNSVLSAPDGGSTISLSNGGVGTGDSCVITVNVTSGIVGTHTNPAIFLSSSIGSSSASSTDLNVVSTLPGFSKSFAPNSIAIGSRSTLTFLIDNTNNDSNVTNLDFTDNLPAGMVIADPANAATDCRAPNPILAPTLTAVPGTTTITLDANGSPVGGNFVLLSGETCTVTVDVVATGSGQLENVSNDLLADFTSSGKASATLTVSTPMNEILLVKDFANDPTPPGSTVDLVFHIQNYNRGSDATDIAFTDDLDATLTGLVATGLPQSNVCGAGSTISGTSNLSLTGGNLPAEQGCTFTVTLQVPAAAAIGAFPNTTSTITANVNGSPYAGSPTTDTLFVEPVPQLSKAFLQSPVVAGGSIDLQFTITNTSNTSSATDIAFLDELTNFLPFPISATLPPVPDPPCGAGSSLSLYFPDVDRQGLSLTGGNLAPSASCTFSVTIGIPVGMPPNLYTNITEEISAVVDGTTRIGQPATASFEVIAGPQLSKTFLDDPVSPGDTVTVEYTILASGADMDEIAFTDNFNAALSGLVATGLPQDDICGPGSNITGTTTLAFSSGQLATNTSCTFNVTLQTPASATPNDYLSVTSNITANIDGATATENPASDTLTITGLEFSKAFTNDPVIAGEIATLEFSISNTSISSTAELTFFTDSLSTALSGLTAVAPLPTEPCGPGSTIAGTSSLTYNGGTLGPGESCTFSVDVQVPTNAPDGSYRNTTSNLSYQWDGAPASFSPAIDYLDINSTILEFSKSFVNDPVAGGDTVDLAFTILNTHPTYNVTDIEFSDVLDANLTGLVAVGLPANDVCGVGSQLSGTSTLNFTGGNLDPAASCTFTVTLQVPPGTQENYYVNTTSQPTAIAHDLAMGAFDVEGNIATDNLLVTELGFIVVDKVTIPADNPTPFEFKLTNNATISRTFPLAATDIPDSSPVPPGSGFVLTETVPAGWQLLSATCDNGDGIDNITVNQSQIVTCTFTNTNVADLSINMIDAPDPVIAGNNLTHTITISNSGPLPATNVSVSVTLPISLTYISGAGMGWSCGESAGTVTCDLANLDIGSAPDITLVTAVPPDTPAGFVTTYASVTSDNPDTNSGNNSTSEDTFIGEPKFAYLPLVLNNYVSAPDLVVQSITIPTANSVEIVIANTGNTAVTDSFWVDLYINPNPVPTGVNQIWQSVAAEGAVWGVTDVSALVPGGTMTLTFNSTNYVPAFSNFNGFSNGMNVYVQVDSAHASSVVYGAVLENHEIASDPYNNISSTTVNLSRLSR